MSRRVLYPFYCLLMVGVVLLGANLISESARAVISPPTTLRVSVSTAGEQGNDNSEAPAISADGRFVAFYSDATNLVAGDTNAVGDIFLRDTSANSTVRVSVSSSGAQANGVSGGPTISDDGRFIAFWSNATNLVPNDTNNSSDVFVHDNQTGATERVNVDSLGHQANNPSFGAFISGDGRFVAFTSFATNLGGTPNGNNFAYQVYVHDRQTGTTEIETVDSDGNPWTFSSYASAISGDGRYVVFTGNGAIFIRDRALATTEQVSLGANPAISADGRFVAFESDSSNLVPGDTNGQTDVFVKDEVTGTIERVSVSSLGAEANGLSNSPAISGDGRFVGFQSTASNLVGSDTNSVVDIFVHDRETGATNRVSVDSLGSQANGGSYGPPAMSSDGSVVAFSSSASNLVAGDTNNVEDVFVHALAIATPTPTPTHSPTPTPTHSPTSSPTPTPTNSHTQTPSPTPTSVVTNSPTPTHSPTPTTTYSPSPTPTPTHSPTPTPSPVPTPTHTPRGPIWGDLNCDGVIGAADVMLGLEFAAGLRSSLPCAASADVDCNGVANGLDVLDLLRFISHLPSLVTGSCTAIGSA
jgi:WD40-like Beta Propeller Repeat